MFTLDSAIVSTQAPSSAAVPHAPENRPIFHGPPSRPASSTSNPVSLELGRYKSRLATTDADRDAACRLRFNVFNTELGEGLIDSYATGRDYDQFDPVCDHLIVEDTELSIIVGTYRMQSGAVAAANFGYYSQQEFDFSPYASIRHLTLELGRACIHKDHRTSEVLTLLWRTIARHCRLNGFRYLIGCSSLTSRNPHEGWALYHQLRNFMTLPEFLTVVTPAYRLPATDDNSVIPVKTPKLLRTYIGTGARICSEPAWDRAFGTIDFLTLLDLEQLSPAARTRFRTNTH